MPFRSTSQNIRQFGEDLEEGCFDRVVKAVFRCQHAFDRQRSNTGGHCALRPERSGGIIASSNWVKRRRPDREGVT